MKHEIKGEMAKKGRGREKKYKPSRKPTNERPGNWMCKNFRHNQTAPC